MIGYYSKRIVALTMRALRSRRVSLLPSGASYDNSRNWSDDDFWTELKRCLLMMSLKLVKVQTIERDCETLRSFGCAAECNMATLFWIGDALLTLVRQGAKGLTSQWM